MNRLLRLGGGLLLASALSVGAVALPAGAATKSAPTISHRTSTESFASELANLQGRTVALSNGATCKVSATTCTVVSSGTSSLAIGAVSSVVPVNVLRALMPVGESASLTIGITGFVAALGDILTFGLAVIFL